ncbi:MAG: hypothetical protein RR334_02020, partial [Clostridia bacterium]
YVIDKNAAPDANLQNIYSEFGSVENLRAKYHEYVADRDKYKEIEDKLKLNAENAGNTQAENAGNTETTTTASKEEIEKIASDVVDDRVKAGIPINEQAVVDVMNKVTKKDVNVSAEARVAAKNAQDEKDAQDKIDKKNNKRRTVEEVIFDSLKKEQKAEKEQLAQLTNKNFKELTGKESKKLLDLQYSISDREKKLFVQESMIADRRKEEMAKAEKKSYAKISMAGFNKDFKDQEKSLLSKYNKAIKNERFDEANEIKQLMQDNYDNNKGVKGFKKDKKYSDKVIENNKIENVEKAFAQAIKSGKADKINNAQKLMDDTRAELKVGFNKHALRVRVNKVKTETSRKVADDYNNEIRAKVATGKKLTATEQNKIKKLEGTARKMALDAKSKLLNNGLTRKISKFNTNKATAKMFQTATQDAINANMNKFNEFINSGDINKLNNAKAMTDKMAVGLSYLKKQKYKKQVNAAINQAEANSFMKEDAYTTEHARDRNIKGQVASIKKFTKVNVEEVERHGLKGGLILKTIDGHGNEIDKKLSTSEAKDIYGRGFIAANKKNLTKDTSVKEVANQISSNKKLTKDLAKIIESKGDLKSQIIKDKEQLLKAEKIESEAKSLLEKTRKEIANMKSDKNTTNKERKEKRKELQSLGKNYDNAKTKASTIKDVVNSKELKLKMLKEETTSTKNKIVNIHNQNKETNNFRKLYNQVATELTNKETQLEKYKQSTNKNNKNYNATIKKLEDEKKSLEVTQTELKKDVNFSLLKLRAQENKMSKIDNMLKDQKNEATKNAYSAVSRAKNKENESNNGKNTGDDSTGRPQQ